MLLNRKSPPPGIEFFHIAQEQIFVPGPGVASVVINIEGIASSAVQMWTK
jgi:hypothetical protein